MTTKTTQLTRFAAAYVLLALTQGAHAWTAEDCKKIISHPGQRKYCERSSRIQELDQLRTWFQSTQSQQNYLQDLNDRMEKVIAIMFEQNRNSTNFQDSLLSEQSKMVEFTGNLNQMLQLMSQRSKDETTSRTELVHQFKMVVTDQQERHEQLISTLVNTLALGSVFFFKEILGTIEGNPHPQINYLILILIVGGCYQMFGHVHRINKEGQLIEEFSNAILPKKNLKIARELLTDGKAAQASDASDVLELVLHNFDTAIGSIQQAAIESEIERFHARQNRRLLLAQFMSGMMVGLGLLGTFIGLLGALQEIGKLIGSFSVGSGMADPVAAVNELVSRLTEPMRAMGVAFSASLFGVLGSLIMGMLMVFIKSATVELVSMLQSKSSLLTKLAQDSPGVDAEAAQLSNALNKLAENSPVLQGLIVAMDQSERRVRLMLNSMQELVVQMKENSAKQSEVQQQISQLGTQHQQVLTSLEHMRQDTLEAAKSSAKTTEIQRQSLQILEAEQELLKANIAKNSELVSLTMDMQSRWLDQQHEQQLALNKSTINTAEQVAQERAGWLQCTQRLKAFETSQAFQPIEPVFILDDVWRWDLAGQNPGLAKRRFLEAETIGLFKDAAVPTAKEAADA